MIEPTKRIRDSAPFRKSMSMSSDDVSRADELERIFTAMYPTECPFSFSKTISKALEIALSTVHGSQELPRPPAQMAPKLPETQQTLCLDDQEITRPPTQEKTRHNVQEPIKARTPKIFGKRKIR